MIEELANGAYPASQVEIARWAMAHPGILFLHQTDLALFQVDRMREYRAWAE
jgi:hypothetical protein